MVFVPSSAISRHAITVSDGAGTSELACDVAFRYLHACWGSVVTPLALSSLNTPDSSSSSVAVNLIRL